MTRRMLTLTILATVISILTSCAADTPRDFANRFIEAENKAWNTGDLSDLEALERDDVVYHLPGSTDLKGWEAHKSYIEQGRAMTSDLKQSWKYLAGEGNHLVLSYESTATMRANETNPAMSAAADYLCVFRLEGGRIAEAWMNGSTTTTPAGDAKKE